MEIYTEEQYLNSKGASRLGIGESALHKNRDRSEKNWQFLVNRQAEQDRKLMELREELRQEYKQRVEAGEIRPPTRIESLMQKASGHPDLASTQAAIALLKKHGIDYSNLQNDQS